MIKRNILLTAILLMAFTITPTAHTYEMSGPGRQVFEEDLVGDDVVQAGGVITVSISNNRPGYQRFFIYILGEDDNGNEVMLWGTIVAGTNCRPGTSCTFDIPNLTALGIPATELYVEGYFGLNGSRAIIDHYTTNR